MGTHLYDLFHSLERILEGNQELRKEVLTMFGGNVEFNGCKLLARLHEVHRAIVVTSVVRVYVYVYVRVTLSVKVF